MHSSPGIIISLPPLRCASPSVCLPSFLLQLFDQHLHLVLPSLLVVVIVVKDDAIGTSGRHLCC